jgi:dCTP deaminase
MTILSKNTLETLTDDHTLLIKRIDCNGIHHSIDKTQLQPIGIDLTLSNEFRRFKKVPLQQIMQPYFDIAFAGGTLLILILIFGLIVYTTVHPNSHIEHTFEKMTVWLKLASIVFLLSIVSYIYIRDPQYDNNRNPPIVIDDTLDYKKHTTYEKIGEMELFPIQSGETVIGIVQEHIEVPKNMCGILNGRSRFARMGLSVHITAMFANPNVKNRIVLEIQNLCPHTVYLKPNVRICQMSFMLLDGEAEYIGQFQHQTL